MMREHNERGIRRALALALALCVLGAPAAAAALPPVFRGIDVGTVLAMRDQARQIGYAQRRDAGELDAPKAFQHIKTIVIDPGHGGENQGAIGVAHVHEKFMTLDLAYALRDQLQETYPDARIVLTRYWDRGMGLTERIHRANEEGADLFLSLHYNAAVHDRAVGVETYFLTTEQAIPGGELPKSEPLASAALTTAGMAAGDGEGAAEAKAPGTYNDAMATLQRDLERARQHKNSGLLAEIVQQHMVAQTGSLDRGVKQANFGVLRGALMPAVVVEAGFVTHPKEGERVLREAHRERIVRALIGAIEEFDGQMARQRAD